MPFVVRPEIVAECVAELRRKKIHPTFAGYLCIRRSSVKFGSRSNLTVDFKEFFDTFLRVPDAPEDKPYALPFSDSAPSEANKWFNKNVAGSYAPSSFRNASPLLQVVDISNERRGGSYSLRDDDTALALKHLLYDKPVSVASLAAFLYRDFALLSVAPKAIDLVLIFSEEFGFDSKSTEFKRMFTTERYQNDGEEWFEST